MKCLKDDAGLLTNFEVLDFLRCRGAGKDPTRVIAPIARSEFKVYDYLEQTPACNQTREIIYDFIGKSKKYKLTKAEIFSIINIQPSKDAAEINPILQDNAYLGEEDIQELVDLVAQIFPCFPTQTETSA